MRRPAWTRINTHKRAKTLQGPGSGLGVVSVFRGVRHLRTVAPAAALAVWLGGCASLSIADPDNQPITGNAEQAFASSRSDPTAGDDVLVGLAFSGGGTRASAFAHGVLLEIDQTTVRTRTGTHSLLDSVGFVSGVSGGAVTAGYYGLKKRAALADFRERFLIRNAEAGLDGQGLPLGLQLIGRPFDEAALFALGQVIEDAAGRFTPKTWWA